MTNNSRLAVGLGNWNKTTIPLIKVNKFLDNGPNHFGCKYTGFGFTG